MKDDEALIRLEHGSGGALSRDLVESVIYPALRSEAYTELTDASPLEPGSDFLLTTDGYVVDPPFFPGGDIGRLSVLGTCNDLAVCGAQPFRLSLAITIEEGFPIERFRAALESAAAAARETETRIVTGDTKVVPRGKGGGIFMTTAGVGRRVFPHRLSPQVVRPGTRDLSRAPWARTG